MHRKQGKTIMRLKAGLLGASMVLASMSGAVMPMRAAEQETQIKICGSDVEAAAQNRNGLTYKGFGVLSCNSTSDLLVDYKYQAPKAYEAILDTLFGGEHPLMNHVKIEMGNDGNNSTGADSCTKRSEDEEADASRSPGFILAADAKKVNPDIKISVLRWEMPTWVENAWKSNKKVDGYDACYRWYKETIFDAYEKYGYLPDYVNPDKNETWSPDADFIKWFKNALVEEEDFPEYMSEEAIEKYHQIKIIASDENVSLNIVPSMRKDRKLYDAVDAIGFHYSTGTDTATKDYVKMADEDDKEVWYSEGCGSFSYSGYQKNKTEAYGKGTIGGYQSPLAMCDCMVKSAVYSRKTHYVFQPAIGSFYEGSQYDHKELLSAREPWAGSVHFDEAIYLLGHFSKFAKTGWENEENSEGIWRFIATASDNQSEGTEHLKNEKGKPSYMTLASPDKKDFSIIFVNNSSERQNYRISVEDIEMESDASLELWQSSTDQYMQYMGNVEKEDSSYEIVVEPFSIVTATSLSCHDKPEYQKRLPVESAKYILDTNENGSKLDVEGDILYADDFEYTSYSEGYLTARGNEPRYFVDQSGAFYVENGKLVQGLENKVSQWQDNEPNTVVGDYRWMNYEASVDVYPGENGSAGLVIRQQTGMNYKGSGYSLQIDKSGQWKLMKRETVLNSGKVSGKDSYRLTLIAQGAHITALVDGEEVSSFQDKNPEYFGRIKLFSSWEKTAFDNLKVEKLEQDDTIDTLPYAGFLLDNADDAVVYSDGWNIKCNGSSNDWYRSTSETSKTGTSFSFPINARGFALLGNNATTAKISIEVDGEEIESGASTKTASNHGTSYLYYGLEEGEHEVTVTVNSGKFVLDAILPLGQKMPEVIDPGVIEEEETLQDPDVSPAPTQTPMPTPSPATPEPSATPSVSPVCGKQTPAPQGCAASNGQIAKCIPLCRATNLKCKKQKKKIRITWKRIKEADGYVLQRATGNKGAFRTMKKIVGNKKTTYLDKKIKKGKVYRYRIRCYRKYMDTVIYSSYSKIKKVK